MSVERYKVILAVAQIYIYEEQTNNSESVHYTIIFIATTRHCKQYYKQMGNIYSHSFDNKHSMTLTSSISIRAVWDDIHSEASRIVCRCFQGASNISLLFSHSVG